MNYDTLIENLQNEDYKIAVRELCKRSFLYYLKYVFFIINGSKFLLKDFHKLVIKKLENIVFCNNEKRNLALCLPVGSGKSLIVEYFITWCFARSVNCTFCYTSNSDRLINKLSKECKDIIENEFWQLLFEHPLKKDDRQRVNFSFENAKNRTGLTAGTTGGAITGLDAGNPNIDGFSGALIIDDPLDAGNARYEKAREEVVTFYDEKLATRRRTPTTPTILIMQRLHLDDLVGWIGKNEKDLWDIVKIPALDEDGKSFWEERYPAEELKHIQNTNAFKFQSQYQQEPISLGGSIIKGEWFKYYPINSNFNYKKIVISADTAIQVKEASDYTCFMVGGVTQNNQLHILDILHGKWEYPELKKQAIYLYNKWQLDKRLTSASAFYIEDKASGQQLIQDFKNSGLPVRPIEITKDKLARVEEILDYLASGNVLLPQEAGYGFNGSLIAECESFTRDDSHRHDDMCLVGNTKIATIWGDKYIKDVKAGDFVITPYGLNKVIKSECTGTHEVINKLGLRGTKNHKIYADGNFDKLGSLCDDVNIDTLTLKGLIKWKYKKLLSSTALNINLWGRKGITYLNQVQMQEEKVLKDFMLRFGNFIADKKYQKAILFTIKTAIILITTFLIWNVYQEMNTIKNIVKSVKNLAKSLSKLNTLQKLESLQPNGIEVQRVERGTENTSKNPCQKLGNSEKRENVKFAEKNILQKSDTQNIVVNNVKQKHIDKEKVYNITVEKAQTYYANGVLVSNCDALVHLINHTIAKRKVLFSEII